MAWVFLETLEPEGIALGPLPQVEGTSSGSSASVPLNRAEVLLPPVTWLPIVQQYNYKHNNRKIKRIVHYYSTQNSIVQSGQVVHHRVNNIIKLVIAMLTDLHQHQALTNTIQTNILGGWPRILESGQVWSFRKKKIPACGSFVALCFARVARIRAALRALYALLSLSGFSLALT